jgi:hypothetical protein
LAGLNLFPLFAFLPFLFADVSLPLASLPFSHSPARHCHRRERGYCRRSGGLSERRIEGSRNIVKLEKKLLSSIFFKFLARTLSLPPLSPSAALSPSTPPRPLSPPRTASLSPSPSSCPASTEASSPSNFTPLLRRCLHLLALLLLPHQQRGQFIGSRFLPQKEHEQAAKLEVHPKPDVFAKVFLLFRGIDESDAEGWKKPDEVVWVKGWR